VFDILKLLMSMHKNDVHDHINEPKDKIIKFVKTFNLKNISKY
jgi:rRNA pseudouridine-1189 N-methylase Emg1 (Nep1/Mra1 family)